MDTSTTRDFGAYLKQLRTLLGLSLREVEQRTNRAVTNGYVSQLESGMIKSPSVRVLHALSDVYGVSYSELMRRAGHHVPDATSSSPDPLAGIPLRALEELSEAEQMELMQYMQFIRKRRSER